MNVSVEELQELRAVIGPETTVAALQLVDRLLARAGVSLNEKPFLSNSFVGLFDSNGKELDAPSYKRAQFKTWDSSHSQAEFPRPLEDWGNVHMYKVFLDDLPLFEDRILPYRDMVISKGDPPTVITVSLSD